MKNAIRVPTDSKIWIPNTDGFNSPLKLFGAFMLRLCFPDSDVERQFYYHKNRFSGLLEDMACNRTKPVATPTQAQLSFLSPTANTINLCVGLRSPEKPTHCLTLVRGNDDLWRPLNRKVRPVHYENAEPQLTKDAILVFWQQNQVPSPFNASRMSPNLRHVFLSRRSVASFADQLAGDTGYEARRELSHCVLVSSLFGQTSEDRVTTWHNRGRATMRVDKTVGDGYISPFDFYAVSTRPYVKPGPKPRVLIHATASKTDLLGDFPLSRSIQPQIKESLLHGEPPSKDDELLSELLLTRLLPWIGIANGKHQTIDLYGLSYTPESGKSQIVCYAAERSMRYSHMFPVLIRCKGLWRPNNVLLSLLYPLIFDRTPDIAMRSYRWEALGYVMSFVGAKSPSDYKAVFANRGFLVSEEEVAHIDAINVACQTAISGERD